MEKVCLGQVGDVSTPAEKDSRGQVVLDGQDDSSQVATVGEVGPCQPKEATGLSVFHESYPPQWGRRALG